MPDRTILAIDGSPGAESALAFVMSLPVRAPHEVVVASYPSYFLAARAGEDSVASRLASRARERAAQLVDDAVARLRASGSPVRGVVCDGEDLVDALLRLAESERASSFVVGSRGRGPWTSILLGSTARSLAILSPIPVLVVRAATLPRRVLVATDGSAAALAALAALARLPHAPGAQIELLGVLPARDEGGEHDEEVLAILESAEHDDEDAALARLERERRLLPRDLPVRTWIERGHVGETVLRRAEAIGADLIAVGTRGLSGPRARFWGSTAERVLTQARCNVLVAPATEGPAR